MPWPAGHAEISRGLAEGLLYKEIGVRIGRDPSVVSREVARHGGRAARRRSAGATAAPRHAWRPGTRCSPRRSGPARRPTGPGR
ncbi:helix-turn-helix domain-containing protein [Micromonospora sp. NBC_00860]|uniref:helix-turn-helix domain-containing protein n=1 Tax=Micromonospora sp. NBC_00860 TaxID=2975980 RepID=UPI00386A241E